MEVDLVAVTSFKLLKYLCNCSLKTFFIASQYHGSEEEMNPITNHPSHTNLICINTTRASNNIEITYSPPPTVLAPCLTDTLHKCHKQTVRGDNYKRRYNNEYHNKIQSKAHIENLKSLVSASKAGLKSTLVLMDHIQEQNNILQRGVQTSGG